MRFTDFWPFCHTLLTYRVPEHLKHILVKSRQWHRFSCRSNWGACQSPRGWFGLGLNVLRLCVQGVLAGRCIPLLDAASACQAS